MRNWLVVLSVMAVALLGLGDKAFSMGQAPKNLQVVGKITEVNLKAMTIKIMPTKGKSETLQINEKTRLVRSGRNITLPSLKKDDQVTVTYQKSWGRKIALTVTVQETVSYPGKTTPQKNKR